MSTKQTQFGGAHRGGAALEDEVSGTEVSGKTREVLSLEEQVEIWQGDGRVPVRAGGETRWTSKSISAWHTTRASWPAGQWIR